LPQRRAASVASDRQPQEATVGQLAKLAAAFAAGAAAMYLLDPVAGRRRRTMARDKVLAAGQDIQDFAQDTARHAADRLHGASAHLHAQAPSDDRQLHDRIRSKLGHLVAQPGKVEVHVEDGLVTLSGSARLAEVDELVAAVSDMLGVARVDNRLDVAQLPPASESRH
jgi:osmotically-inducible protein OsmY